MTVSASAHRVVARVVLAGVAAVFAGMGYFAWGYSLKDALGPGPGFFPFWLGGIGLVLCAALFVELRRGGEIGEGAEAHWPDQAGAWRAGVLLAGAVVAALAFEPLGYRLTAATFSVALMLALGARNLVGIGIFAVVASFGVFHVFYYWLKVPLPIGKLGL